MNEIFTRWNNGKRINDDYGSIVDDAFPTEIYSIFTYTLTSWTTALITTQFVVFIYRCIDDRVCGPVFEPVAGAKTRIIYLKQN